RKFAWASLTVLSLAGWSALAWYWHPVRAMMVSGRLPILPVLVGLLLVHAVGAIAWSRAIVHIVRDDRFQPQSLPHFVRHPWTAAIAGLVAPGAGLAMAGHAFRSALALWNAACVALAALLLTQANLLWTWNAKTGADGMPKTFVEGLFVAAAAM